MIGVPVGPGEEDVEDPPRDLLQLVRINSFPGSTDRQNGRQNSNRLRRRSFVLALDGIAEGVAFDRDYNF